LIKTMREKNQNVLLLDCGDSFSGKNTVPELRAEASIKGMSLMNYDGLNIADGELSLGLNLFEKLRHEAGFPLLSANIYRRKNNQPVGKEFLIKEFSGFKAGIIGLTSPEYVKENTLIKEELVVKDPESTTRGLLTKMKSQVDIIILLSHLGKQNTSELVKNVSGIDVAILGHKLGVAHEVELVDKTILVHSGLKGKHLGILELTLDNKGSIVGHEARLARLSKETPVDSTIAELVKTFEAQKRSSLRKARAQKRKERESEEKAGGPLHMTPEKFIEEMQREDRLIDPKDWKNKINQ
jgi:2',3'-cyclic-nucleotide 2'-phosphodiesterase (5'-nucleotidase family)